MSFVTDEEEVFEYFNWPNGDPPPAWIAGVRWATRVEIATVIDRHYLKPEYDSFFANVPVRRREVSTGIVEYQVTPAKRHKIDKVFLGIPSVD